MKGTAMTAQQRDMVDQILRNAPFDLGGDVAAQRPILEQMLTSQPLPADVRMTPADLGGIPVIFIDIADVEARGTIFHIHGGGFALGSAGGSVGLASSLARKTGMRAVSVDYRLAPEHPYPAAIDDAWAATQWVAGHGDELGADASRLAVAGDSAGGTISAVITQRARDNGGPPIRFQLLWYPSTMWDPSLPSFTENADAAILDRDSIAAFSRYYAGEVDLSDPPPGMAPGRAESLAGLPPAYIGVAGHDPLRDDGIRYGELLAAAGVPVEVDNAETLVHGYVGYAGVVPAATAALDRALAALRAALH
jgi:acetyl esterase/lipase